MQLDLTSPWMNAAGMIGFAPPDSWPWAEPAGAWVTNPISLGARSPAENRAACDYPGGLLLHTGLPNPGLPAVLRRHAAAWARSALPCWVHIFGHNAAEIHQMVLRLEEVEGVAAIELGLAPDCAPETALAQIEAALGELPLVVSLPFNRANEDWLLQLALMGVTGLTLAAPYGALPQANGRLLTGRLYGPSLLPQVLAAVKAAQRLDLPLIAGAGVYRLENAKALLQTGASAVQVDTALWLPISTNSR